MMLSPRKSRHAAGVPWLSSGGSRVYVTRKRSPCSRAMARTRRSSYEVSAYGGGLAVDEQSSAVALTSLPIVPSTGKSASRPQNIRAQ